MVDEHTRLEAFRRDCAHVRASADPVWLRHQLGLPPRPSLGFTIVIACIGALALMGIVVAVGSI